MALALLACGGTAAVERILLVGDCWADDLWRWRVCDTVLAEEGLGEFQAIAEHTTERGSPAEWWVQPAYLERITKALANHPSIDIVHLILSANDLNGPVQKGIDPTAGGPEQTAQFLAQVRARIQTVVDHILAQRPNMKVLLSDYSYLDIDLMRASTGSAFCGATHKHFNESLAAMGKMKRTLADETDRCDYVQNFGILQYYYGNPPEYPPQSVPFPGDAFDYDPFPGGDPAKHIPPATFDQMDGSHPVAAAQQHIFRNCVQQFLRAWLTDTEPPRVLRVARLDNAPAATDRSPVTFSVQFNERVRGVHKTPPFDGFQAWQTGAAGIPVPKLLSVEGKDDTYTATVEVYGDGEVHLDVLDDNTVQDIAYNPLGGPADGDGRYAEGETFTVANFKPDPDLDRDGLTTDEEIALGTDGCVADTDGDGIGDGDEVHGTRGFVTNPLWSDTDSDGNDDDAEIARGSDPAQPAGALQKILRIGAGIAAAFLALAALAAIPSNKPL
jgi:hypothetical protein